jgi:hypothetical protein
MFGKTNNSNNNSDNNSINITNNNTDNNSDILQLEKLEKVFENLMKEYELANQNYMASLNNNKNFKYIKSKAYWGTDGIEKHNDINNVNNCIALCSNDSKCSGATFNSDKERCWTRTGKSDLINGDKNDYAIIPQVLQDTIILNELNDKLTKVNTQINNLLNKMYPKLQSEIELKDEKRKQLVQNNNILKEQKNKIQKIISEHELLNQSNDDSYKLVNKNRMVYYIIIAICVILMIVIGNQSVSSSNMSGGSKYFINSKMFNFNLPSLLILKESCYIILFMIITLIIANKFNKIIGYILWSLIIMMIVVYKMKILKY